MSVWRRVRDSVLPTLLFGGLLVAALVYLDEIRAWFSLAPMDTPEASAPAAAGAASSGPELPPYTFPDAAKPSLLALFDAAEEARALLARDAVEGLAELGPAITGHASAAAEAAPDEPAPIGQALLDAAAAGERLAAAGDAAEARQAFAGLSRALVGLAVADPSLQAGRHLFECPMAGEFGFNKWLQRSKKLENPYMGSRMLSCGSASTFAAPPPAEAIVSHAGHGHQGGDTSHYTCSMHPSVRQPGPGTCPICSMDLTPVTFDEEEGGVLFVDEARRQRIGLRLGTVERGPMLRRIRTVGKLTYDETKLVDVTVKYEGWIGQLFADAVGKRVKRGHALFTVYSPEIYAAQGDLLTALGSGPALPSRDADGDAGDATGPMFDLAKERLALWDVPGSVAAQVRKSGKPMRYVPVVSPASGYVVEKNVVAGSAFKPGQRLLRIAGLDRVWIEAELYEADLALVRVGQKADVTLSYLPDKRYRGEVTFVYPYLDGRTRTARARIELDNHELELKPDMFANVSLDVDLGERLRVPAEAVVYTGPRRLVFVDLGGGRLRPQEVELGVRDEDHYQVLDGLQEGERVVTSGNFLVAAESRIRSAERYWSPAPEGGEAPKPEATHERHEHGMAPGPAQPAPAATPAAKSGAKPVVYWCPMHKEVQQSAPGTCPICHMALEKKP